tara:strand:- start:4227 stop:4631 length:405 start_codon:yes stop_codon:yes gene_type:complete
MQNGTTVKFNAGPAKKTGVVVEVGDVLTIESDGVMYRRRAGSVVEDFAPDEQSDAEPRAPIARRDAPTPHTCPRGHSGELHKGLKVVHNYSSPRINEQNRRHYFRCRVCLIQWTEVRPIEVHTVAATLTNKGGK